MASRVVGSVTGVMVRMDDAPLLLANGRAAAVLGGAAVARGATSVDGATTGTGVSRGVLVRRAWKYAVLAVGAAGTLAAWQAFGWHPTIAGGDAWNYLAAGERLNAGHLLYALSPGDRPVTIVPPYWTVPLLAPPPVAVLWRVLAPLGDAAMVLWGLTALAAVAWSCWELRGSLVVLAALSVPLALTALSGNASAFILAGFVAAWRWRDRPWIVGPILAATVAVKLTPVYLLLWLVLERRWRALAAALAAGAAIFAVSLVLTGPDAWLAWLRSVPQSAPSPLALATLTGLPTWTVMAAGALTVALASLARRERLTFGAAVMAAALATPALYFQALGLLAAI